MWGLVLFFILIFLSNQFQLHTINWLLRQFILLGPVAIVILFYPELRHFLEEMGRFSGWGKGFVSMPTQDIAAVIGEIVRAAVTMSQQRIGALIVLERETALDNFAEAGTRLDAEVTADLLGTIFHPGTPLHDGAVIIRGNKVIAAACILPLSDSQKVGRMVHTRHKAALGLTEETDAVVVVVSEETGTISLSQDGKLYRGLNEETLRERLHSALGVIPQVDSGFRLRRTVNGTLKRVGFRSQGGS